MERIDTDRVIKLIKEHFEANDHFKIDAMVDEIIDELELPKAQDLRNRLIDLAGRVHEEIQDEAFDYDNVSDQSFPASDPPPIP